MDLLAKLMHPRTQKSPNDLFKVTKEAHFDLGMRKVMEVEGVQTLAPRFL